MSEPPLQEWACRLLEDQLMRLAELRNANPRDAGFKLWRQTTLTVIQRVWPGNLPRSERFRRIPFTPPSPRPSRAQVREHFERGCAEATGYLRELIVEIQNGALDRSRAEAEPQAPPPTGPSASQVAASLAAPLPGELEQPEIWRENSPGTSGAAPPPIPGFLSSSLSAAAGPGAAPSRPQPARPTGAGPPPSPPSPAEGPKRGAPARPAKPPRRERRALKEMLGFGDESAPPEAEESESYEAERPGASFGDLAPPPAAVDRLTPDEPPRGPAPQDEAPAEEETLPDDRIERLDEDEPMIGADPEELLRSAPWAAERAAAAAASASASPAKSSPRSPVAAALQALAGEVAELGVPEGKRAAARAALTDLARQIEDRTADWNTLRDAFDLAMEYPPLARRVVPLLVPYLDLP